MKQVTVFAPASVANLGPGFDILGVAVEGLGDWVTATRRHEPGVVIDRMEGDNGRLSLDPAKNTAGIAAREMLRLIGREDLGVSLRVRKGLPLGSGLGSSGASAAAAAVAINTLFDQPLGQEALLYAGLVAESAVSGWHADNVGPSLFGGFLLIRSYDPLDIVSLPTPPDLTFALVTPDCEVPTCDARAVVPRSIALAQHVANSGNLAAMVAGLFQGSVSLLARSMQDCIVEPARASLIPCFTEVKSAALEAGALACSISGAGPTLFALSDNVPAAWHIAHAMQAAFQGYGSMQSHAHVARVDQAGARVVEERQGEALDE